MIPEFVYKYEKEISYKKSEEVRAFINTFIRNSCQEFADFLLNPSYISVRKTSSIELIVEYNGVELRIVSSIPENTYMVSYGNKPSLLTNNCKVAVVEFFRRVKESE